MILILINLVVVRDFLILEFFKFRIDSFVSLNKNQIKNSMAFNSIIHHTSLEKKISTKKALILFDLIILYELKKEKSLFFFIKVKLV